MLLCQGSKIRVSNLHPSNRHAPSPATLDVVAQRNCVEFRVRESFFINNDHTGAGRSARSHFFVKLSELVCDRTFVGRRCLTLRQAFGRLAILHSQL